MSADTRGLIGPCDPEEHDMEWEGNYEYGELYICTICGHEEVKNGIF